jgi:hypothetical protein
LRFGQVSVFFWSGFLFFGLFVFDRVFQARATGSKRGKEPEDELVRCHAALFICGRIFPSCLLSVVISMLFFLLYLVRFSLFCSLCFWLSFPGSGKWFQKGKGGRGEAGERPFFRFSSLSDCPKPEETKIEDVRAGQTRRANQVGNLVRGLAAFPGSLALLIAFCVSLSGHVGGTATTMYAQAYESILPCSAMSLHKHQRAFQTLTLVLCVPPPWMGLSVERPILINVIA